MQFKDIPGHEDVKKALRQMADTNHIPHALLLEGPEGIGKHALARAFLQYVGCRNRHDGDSCGQCASCVQHAANQHIDTVFSFPYVNRKNSKETIAADYMPEFIAMMNENPYMDKTVWLEQLGMPNTPPSIFVQEANALIRRLSFAPSVSKYNSLLLWQADRLNERASNKLLKLIEEPPGQSILIMTSDLPRNILPTIYSRVQRIKVKRLSDSEIVQWMIDNSNIDRASAESLAPLARGSVSAAVKILSGRDDADRFLEYFKSLMRLAYSRDINGLKNWSLKLAAEKRDTIVEFFEYTARLVRENFVANLKNSDLNLMTAPEAEFSFNFARFINEKNVVAIIEAVDEAIADIRANVNAKIVLFDFSITIILKLKQ